MYLRNDYPYNEALDDLVTFFKLRIKNDFRKKELLGYLETCRREKTVTFRYIYEKFIEYTNENKDYEELTDKDKEMIDDLFHFWG
jgi:hypothetical protein